MSVIPKSEGASHRVYSGIIINPKSLLPELPIVTSIMFLASVLVVYISVYTEKDTAIKILL